MSKYFWKILEESQACLMSQIKTYIYTEYYYQYKDRSPKVEKKNFHTKILN